jgi:hypothetical protein
VAKKSSKIAVNGRILEVQTDLDNGAYTVKYKGELIGEGGATSGGKFVSQDGAPLREVLGNNPAGIQQALTSSIENENKAILNNNASKTQKLNLRDMGYGNKLDIKGVTTPAEPDNDTTPAPPTGNGETPDNDGPPATPAPAVKPPEVQDLGGQQARYPAGQIDGEYDHVLFTIVEYVPAGLDGVSALVTGAGRPTDRIKRSSPVGSVILPMPRNIADSNSVSFAGDKMNALQAAATSVIGGILSDAPVRATEAAVANISGALGDNKTQLKDTVRAKVTQDIIGGGNVLTRTTGAVLNSNLELLFSGPELRTFKFQYTMTPRDKAEAASCKHIIRMFKKAMAPKLKEGALFLYTPNMFFVDFIHKGGVHPFLNRIKPCALTNFGVTYTPDNAYMTYEDGSPVAYNLSFSFQEIEPIYDKDYESGDGAEGMGF